MEISAKKYTLNFQPPSTPDDVSQNICAAVSEIVCDKPAR